MRDAAIEKLAIEYYDPKMPYHNFGHIIYVLKFSDDLIRRCRNEGIVIDESVVYYALLFHDAAYHENHIEKGFESKEAYSASLAARELEGNGISQDVIEKVKAAILSTHCDAHCYSNEDIAVRAADLSGMGSDYEFFKENAIKLKRESEMMSDTHVSWKEWKHAAIERIELFLREELELTNDYYDAEGDSIFHKRVRKNLKTLMSDESESI